MNNALIFFYNIYVFDICKINNEYHFSYNGFDYIVFLYNRSIYEIDDIYNLNKFLLNNRIDTFEIIPTKDNNIIFSYENVNYILMKLPKIKNRIINFNDIIDNNFYVKDDFLKINRSYWSNLWEDKINFIEQQFSEVDLKYKTISCSINYYLGIFENAISYYNSFNFKKEFSICHIRVYDGMDYLSFINPLNLVVDSKIRDISEYLKSYILNNNFSRETIVNVLDMLSLNKSDAILLISRCLFPTRYFDLYEMILNKKIDEASIDEVIDKNDSYICFLKILFLYYQKYNIYYIDWIKKEI